MIATLRMRASPPVLSTVTVCECAPSALVVKLCAEDPFLGELMASEDTGEYAAFLLQQAAEEVTQEADEDAFLRKNYNFDRVTELLEQNPNYIMAVREGMLRKERLNLITEGITDAIPRHLSCTSVQRIPARPTRPSKP